jgi:hypothetical protein
VKITGTLARSRGTISCSSVRVWVEYLVGAGFHLELGDVAIARHGRAKSFSIAIELGA